MVWKPTKKSVTRLLELNEETQEEVLTFVGKKRDTYEKKWRHLSRDKSGMNLSWNWAAFVFGFFWFAYRQMTTYAYGFLGAIFFIDVLLIIISKEPRSIVSYTGAYIVIAMLANQLYLNAVFKKVEKLKAQYPDRKERIEVIKKIGRVSWTHVLLYIIVFTIYMYTISFLNSML
jgi:hypothetical protein